MQPATVTSSCSEAVRTLYVCGGCSKFLFFFPVIQALALRPCAVLRGCGFKHIGSQKAEKRNRTNGSIVVVVVVVAVVVGVVVVVALAVRNRSGIGPESSATVRQEAVKIQAKRNTRGPELVRKVLQRSEKKQSKYKLNATLAVRNRSGKICNGPKRSIQNTS